MQNGYQWRMHKLWTAAGSRQVTEQRLASCPSQPHSQERMAFTSWAGRNEINRRQYRQPNTLHNSKIYVPQRKENSSWRVQKTGTYQDLTRCTRTRSRTSLHYTAGLQNTSGVVRLLEMFLTGWHWEELTWLWRVKEKQQKPEISGR